MARWPADSSSITADSSITVDVRPSTVYNFAGVLRAQPSELAGSVDFEFPPQRIIPAPRVRGRSITWQQAIQMAEGSDYQRVQWYPVYQFGGGLVQRIFLEQV